MVNNPIDDNPALNHSANETFPDADAYDPAVHAMRVSSPSAHIDMSLTAVIAAMVLGTTALITISVLPILLAALVSAGKIDTRAIGQIATGEMLGLATGSAFGAGLLRRGSFRLKILAAAAFLIAINIICWSIDAEIPLLLARTASGLLEGVLLAASMMVITYTKNPEKMNSYFMSASVVPMILCSYALPAEVTARGPDYAFTLLACFGVVSILAGLRLPVSFPVQTQDHRGDPAVLAPPWAKLGIFAVLVQFTATGAALTYAVQLAKEMSISDATVGVALAGLTISGMVSAFIVGWVGWKLKESVVLPLGALCQAITVAIMCYSHAPALYVTEMCLFGALWNGLITYALKMLIGLDPSRRLALLLQPVSMLGLAVGPLLASLVVGENDVTPAFASSAALYSFGGGLFLIVFGKIRSKDRRMVAT
ncbi:MFS transporter [Sphingopyxis sp.]|uniref:MFS transporter n=1 Tax=Sphingopyxis sp. TaxID=1908224 RepID=UPI002D79338F|nr:MFS transporter [Sphingopyxis sp.]HET6522892.1 MFS transporter [Sphingopyxis sp.]